MLETVRSRCQKIVVDPIASEDIVLALKNSFEIKDSLAEDIAKKAIKVASDICVFTNNNIQIEKI